jgi:hypothetical protein
VMAMTNDIFAHQNLIRVMSLGFAVCLGAGLREFNGLAAGTLADRSGERDIPPV